MILNDELPYKMASHAIEVKPMIESFTEDGVVLIGGERISNVDEVKRFTNYDRNICLRL